MKAIPSGLFYVALLSSGLMSAQELPRYAFSIGTGFVAPVGDRSDRTDVGWNIGGGAGVNISEHLGAMIDFNYDRLGLSSTALSQTGFPNGFLRVYSLTLDPTVHLTPHGRFDLYATGGGGLYHQSENFRAPDTALVTDMSYSQNKPGINAGLGVAFGTRWHGKIFAEARWNRIFGNDGIHTDYLPVTFGFRW